MQRGIPQGNRATCTDRVVGGRLKAVVAAVQLRNRLHASSRQRPPEQSVTRQSHELLERFGAGQVSSGCQG